MQKRGRSLFASCSLTRCPWQDFGCRVSFSEMADAQKLMLEGYEGRRERARLYRAPNEGCFGLQIATTTVSEGVFAGRLAAASGLDFLGLSAAPVRVPPFFRSACAHVLWRLSCLSFLDWLA